MMLPGSIVLLLLSTITSAPGVRAWISPVSTSLRRQVALSRRQSRHPPGTTWLGRPTERDANTIAATEVHNFTFPCYAELVQLPVGDYVESDSFKVRNYTFQIRLVPRASNLPQRTGFGMAYQPEAFVQTRKQQQAMGLFLHYLNTTSPVDVTFEMRLQGQQGSSKRFDIVWTAGMRFGFQTLAAGTAHNFGTHFMTTNRLSEFLEANEPVQLQLALTFHSSPFDDSVHTPNPTLPRWMSLDDIRHDPNLVRAGRIVVPMLTSLQ